MLVITEVQEKPIDPDTWDRLKGRVTEEMKRVTASAREPVPTGTTQKVADFLLDIARFGYEVKEFVPKMDWVVFAGWRDAVWYAYSNLQVLSHPVNVARRRRHAVPVRARGPSMSSAAAPSLRRSRLAVPVTPSPRPSSGLDLTVFTLSYDQVQRQGGLNDFLDTFFVTALHAPELCTDTLKEKMAQIVRNHAPLIEKAAQAVKSSASKSAQKSPRATQQYFLLEDLYRCLADHIRRQAPTITPAVCRSSPQTWRVLWVNAAEKLEANAEQMKKRTKTSEQHNLVRGNGM